MSVSSVPGFDVLFPNSPSGIGSTASSTPSTTATTTPSDTYTPSTPAATTTSTTAPLVSEGTPVDLNQPGTVLADGSVVPGDPTNAASIATSSTDPYWATDAPDSDFDTPVPGFSTLFPSGVEPNAAVNIANAAAAGPTPYQALDKQIIAASDSELLSSMGTGSSSSSDQANGDLGGVSSLLAQIQSGYNAGAYGAGTGIDTFA
jgi:hypothetical protein